MKTKLVALFAVTLTIMMFGAFTFGHAQDKKPAPAGTEEVTFLTNLHCANCAKKIQDKLPFEKGVKDMKIDVDKKTVWIQYQTAKTNKEKLQKAIVKIGYSAEEIVPEPAKQ